MQPKRKPLRERVERGIYKRSTRDGKTTRYEVAFVDSDGRQRWRTVDRLQEARELRAELVSKVKHGERVAPSKITLIEYADEWLERQEAPSPEDARPLHRVSAAVREAAAR
jgi:hypothetical protein